MDKPPRALIVRSHQKDHIYIEKLKNILLNVIDPFIDNNYRIKAVETLDLTSKIIYYFGTTAQCLQTLGEEYVGLVAVNTKSTEKLSVPSPMILKLYSITQSLSVLFGRMIIRVVMGYLHLYRGCNTDSINQLRSGLNTLLRIFDVLNTQLFYVLGDGYRLAQRFLGIGYITLSPVNEDHISTSLFKIIGLVNLSRFISEFWTVLRQLRFKPDQQYISQQTPSDGNNHFKLSKCSLCLENPCRDATAITCGHVFCWDCIIEAIRITKECPLCRTNCHPSRLIHLRSR